MPKTKNVKLNIAEVEFLNSLVESQKLKIEFLDAAQKRKAPIKNDLRIVENLTRKLSFA
jgi:hypothetical protein